MQPDSADQPTETLTRDPQWEPFRFNSYERFQNLADRFSLRPEVEEAITRHFDPARKAVLYSYFDYDLLEVAEDRALLSLEFALRRRYREMDPDVDDPDTRGNDEPYNLDRLIDWAERENLLEDIERRSTPYRDDKKEEHILHQFRDWRNNKTAHPDRWIQRGYFALYTVSRVADVINHLYEDPEARRRRHDRLHRDRQILDDVFDERGILEIPTHFLGNETRETLLVFKAAALHCTEYDNEIVTHFAFQPIFDPKEGSEGEVMPPKPIEVRVVSTTLDSGAIELTDVQGRKWILWPPSENSEEEKFSDWRGQLSDEEYNQACSITQVAFGNRAIELRSYQPEPA
jgi:hypothetical protein